MISFLLYLLSGLFGPAPEDLRPRAVSCGATLSEPRAYVVEHDCSSSAATFLFNVVSDSVSLDLGGRTFHCEDPGAKGILANNTRNFRVWNGRITGCHTGVEARYAHGLRIEQVAFVDLTAYGVNVSGNDNQIVDSRFERIGRDGVKQAFGIVGPGVRSVVAGNVFVDIGQGSTGGIAALVIGGVADCLFLNNTFAIKAAEPGDFPIWIVSGASVILKGNTLSGYPAGIAAVPGAQVYSLPPSGELAAASSTPIAEGAALCRESGSVRCK